MSPRTLAVISPRDFYGQLLELLERATTQARASYTAHLRTAPTDDDWFVDELRNLGVAMGAGGYKIRVYLAARAGLL